MAAPVFLSSGFGFFERMGVTDVQTIIDDFEYQVTHRASPVWTVVSAGLYKSPVDAAGRWFDMLLTRIAANKLEMRVRDAAGTTICTRRMQIGTAHVYILFGEMHAHICADSGSWTPEFVEAGLLDCTPDAQNSHTHVVYGQGIRNTSDVWDSNYTSVAYAWMLDNAAAACVARASMFSAGSSYVNQCLTTLNGSRMYREVSYFALPTGDATNYRVAGRRYQSLFGTSDLPMFARVSIPVDTGVSGIFLVTAIPYFYMAKILMRIA
jgi:hypothetical protein